MANQIVKTTQSLTTAAEMREITKMLMKPNANWEEYLTPAPLSIAIMGELVFISSSEDFSINKNPPKNGFKYISYPESFKACLMQICNAGWHAFNEAHKNMDQIRIHTSTVPDYMKAAVNILFNTSNEVIQNVLPQQLENIRSIADDCVILAEGVEKKYCHVINLIQELLEACVNAEHFYGAELERVKMKLKEAEMKEESTKKMNELYKKDMDSMSKQMEEAQKVFKDAMDSLPSGWDMIGMDFVEALTRGLTGLAHGVASRFGLVEPTQEKQGKKENRSTDVQACSKSGEILSLAESLKMFVIDKEIDWDKLYDQKNNSMKSQWIQGQLQRLFKDFANTQESPLAEKALSLCKRGIDICEELATYKPGEKWDEKKTEDVINNIMKFNDGARHFDCKSKELLASPALTPKPPMMYKEQDESSEPKSASQRATESARFKIEQSREQLNHSRQSYEKSVENMAKTQKELNEILTEMQNCKITEIDFNTKINMLVKGLDAMGRVKQQWEKMVHFFQMVSNIIRIALSKTMHSFVQTSESTQKLSYNDKLYTKDLLYNQAFQASNIASLVHMISETYTVVSTKYLMDRVSSLGKLMAMDKTKPEFHEERKMLEESCQEAQEGILKLVLENKKEFEMNTCARIAKIEGELKAILPEALPQETEKIKEIVKDGFDKAQGDYY